MHSWKILLVDDDPEDREIIKDAMALISSDGVLHFAGNGEEALAELHQFMMEDAAPCLVVLDLNMPKMNGTETLRHIKKNDRLKQIPVIIYSTSINPLEKEMCMQLGAYDYITKPVSLNESHETAKRFYEFCR